MTSLLITLLPFIRQDMMLNYFQAGLLVSAYSVTSGLSQILGGWLSDRWGNRRTVLLTLIAIGPAILLFTTVNYFPALAVLMIAVGILWTMREIAVQTYLMEKTPLHMHGLVIGIYFGVGRQGQSLLQPVYGVFMDMSGISNVFLIVGLIGMATSIVTIFIARKI